MALITDESIERVRQAADIVEVVSAHTDLRRQGAQMMGLCPFHEERSPSFSVDPARKVYHCFGCGVGGDVIRFVREKDGLGFPLGGRAAGRALWGGARARAGGSAGGGAAQAAGADGGSAAADVGVLRGVSVGFG